MIVPMNKYTFLVHHSEYKDFLNGVRNLGLLHVRYRETTPSEELLSGIRLQKEIRETRNALRQRPVARKDGREWTEAEGLDMVHSFRELTDKMEVLHQELNAVQKEIDFLAPWGDFSVEMLSRLRQAGIDVHFFICPQKKFRPEWKGQFPLKVINTSGPDLFFVIFTSGEEGPEIDIDAEEISPAEESLSGLILRQEQLKERIEAGNASLDHFAEVGLPALEAALEETENTIQLLTVIESTREEAGGAVMLLEGFAPLTRKNELEGFCEERNVPFLVENPRPEDMPPVLLKNSAFTRLFEPIGELFSLPAYQELDLTPFFAPFFMMFFGFCLGDAGYGLVLLIGATLFRFRAKKELRPVLSLVQFLGIATVIFGALTGTFFGLNLLDEQFAWLGGVREVMLSSDQTFQLALIMGLVQILFGLFLQAYNKTRQFGFKYAIATYGWIILVLSIFELAVLKKTGSVSFYTAWLGVGLILLFNDPDTGLFGRLGKGLWELYGITGIFGDLLSYIRLFALGISSAILGYVVNDISWQIKGIPYLGPVLFLLFLVVGHGANLLIASLGAFVHPMRLTFVEFYKNAGFTGGGKAYKPLSTKQGLIKQN